VPGSTKVEQESCRIGAKVIQHGYSDRLGALMWNESDMCEGSMADEHAAETSEGTVFSSHTIDRMVHLVYLLALRICIGAMFYLIGYGFGYGVGFTRASSPDLDTEDAPESWAQTVDMMCARVVGVGARVPSAVCAVMLTF